MRDGSGTATPRERIAALEAEVADLRTASRAAQAAIEAELAIARRIQRSLIPAVPQALLGWRLATAYRPARSIGGDFYDIYPLPTRPDLLGLAVADVTGKGMSAALMMAFSRAVLRAAAYNSESPSGALERTNHVLVEDAVTGLFLTAWLAHLDGATGQVRYASAGHEPPLLVEGPRRRVRELPGGGLLAGAFRELGATDRLVTVAPGDSLVAYTDGVTDAADRQGRRFGDTRFRTVLRDHAGAGPDSMVEAVLAAVDAWTGDVSASDDLTLVVLARA